MVRSFILRLLVTLLVVGMLLAPPLGLWFAVERWGTPHIVYHYTFYDNGRPYDPFRPRTYITCTYWGAVGSITLYAQTGRCPWFRLIKRRAGL